MRRLIVRARQKNMSQLSFFVLRREILNSVHVREYLGLDACVARLLAKLCRNAAVGTASKTKSNHVATAVTYVYDGRTSASALRVYLVCFKHTISRMSNCCLQQTTREEPTRGRTTKDNTHSSRLHMITVVDVVDLSALHNSTGTTHTFGASGSACARHHQEHTTRTTP